MKKIRVDLKGKQYTAELSQEKVDDGHGLRSKGRYFHVYDSKENVIGCIFVFLGHMIELGWNSTRGWEGKITENFIENLILTITPHISFPISKDELYHLYEQSRYFQVFIRNEKDQYFKEKNELSIYSGANPKDLVHRLTFQDEITDEKIQNEILRILSDQWDIDYQQPSFTLIIANQLFIFGNQLLKNIDYLVKEGLVDWLNPTQVETNRTLRINKEGLKYVHEHFIRVYKEGNIFFMVDIAGRDINKIHSTGPNAKNIINTGTQTLDSAFNELKEAIEQEYTGENKTVLLQQADALKKEAKENPDKKSVIVKLYDLAKEFAMHHTIATIITANIIPLLQEAAKLAPHVIK